jgi:hypothetical protein
MGYPIDTGRTALVTTQPEAAQGPARAFWRRERGGTRHASPGSGLFSDEDEGSSVYAPVLGFKQEQES